MASPKKQSKVFEPIQWRRADPDALRSFDPQTKVCVMNCGQHSLDPRTPKEVKLLCDECQERNSA